jgi:phosphatidylglycerol---prolipoprotein diacylglyceryl transferase
MSASPKKTYIMSSTTDRKILIISLLVFILVLPVYVYMLKGNLDFPTEVSIWQFNFRMYAVFIMLGIGVGAYLFNYYKAQEKDLKQVDTLDALLWIIIPAIVGGRIWHLITDFAIYKDNLIEMFYIWNGGLGIFGGIIAGLLGAYLYSKKIKVNLIKGLSLLAVFLPIGQVIGRFGNFANKELYGFETDLPWGLYIEATGKSYHPSFLYEKIGMFALFILMFMLFTKRGIKEYFIPLYIGGYGLVRFIVDFFRTEPEVIFGFTVGQVASIAMVLIAVLYFVKLRQLSK